MERKTKDFWEDKWTSNHIPFHKEGVHPALLEHKELFPKRSNSRVFVPLCGKSVDLHWFTQNGYEVVGVELSKKAIEDFFKEQNLKYKKEEQPYFTSYQAKSLTLLQGDIFQLPHSNKENSSFDLIYDRAALIALSYEDRKEYYKLLKSILKPQGAILLIAFESVENPPKTPPYPIKMEELKEHLGENFKIKLIGEDPEINQKVYWIQGS